jgi:hypothetical protein
MAGLVILIDLFCGWQGWISYPELWIFLQIIASLLWIFAFNRRKSLPALGLLISLICIIFVCRASPPLFEDDHYRYYWDGVQSQTGRNPYAHPPADSVPVTSSSEGWEEIRHKINFPQYTTIYGPVAQILFRFCASIAGSSMQNFLLSFILLGAVVYLLIFPSWLKSAGDHSPWVTALWFAHHPLIVKEWWQSCHVDLWMVNLMIAAMLWSSSIWGALLLSASVNIKFPVGIIGSVILPESWRQRFAWTLGLLLLLILPWLIYFPEGLNYFKSVGVFGSKWEMNSGLFRLVREGLFLTSLPTETCGMIARVVMATVYFLVCGIQFRLNKDRVARSFWLMFLMVLFSPVANSWYFTWSLPLVLVLPDCQRKALFFAFAAVPMSYAFYRGENAWPAFTQLWSLEHLWIGFWAASAFFLSSKENCIWQESRGFLRQQLWFL